MRSRYRIIDAESPYFLTATVVHWLPVFTYHDTCDIVVEALQFCRNEKALRIYAYVIMENHIHLVVQAPQLGRVLQSFKRHTARMLIKNTQQQQRAWLLNQLQYFRQKHKTESTHQLWQEGMHPQQIQNVEMLRQKITYIHNNPVRRGCVDAPEHWRYSSARCYLTDDKTVTHPVLEVDPLPNG